MLAYLDFRFKLYKLNVSSLGCHHLFITTFGEFACFLKANGTEMELWRSEQYALSLWFEMSTDVLTDILKSSLLKVFT